MTDRLQSAETQMILHSRLAAANAEWRGGVRLNGYWFPIEASTLASKVAGRAKQSTFEMLLVGRSIFGMHRFSGGKTQRIDLQLC